MPSTVSQGPEDHTRARRRGFAVLTAAAVLLGMAVFFTATGQSEVAPQVTIVKPGAAGDAVPLESAGEPAFPQIDFKVRVPGKKTTTIPLTNAYSVEQLVNTWNQTSSVDFTPYAYVEVDRPVGDPLVFRSALLTKPAAYSDQQAVVYRGADGNVHLLRPQTADNDYNGSDEVIDSGNITFRLLKDARKLKFTTNVSPAHPKPGQRVTFGANIDPSSATSGERFHYSWSEKNGEFNAEGLSVKHTFAKAGTYLVRLFITSDLAAGTKGHTTVKVVVGKEVKSKKDQTGGGTNSDSSAPDSGASDGSTGGYTGSTSDLPTYDGYDAGAAAAPVTPAAVTPDPAPVPTPTTPKSTPTATTPATTVPTAPGESTVTGTVLTGLSLAAATVPAAAAASASKDTATRDAKAAVAARQGTPEDRPDPNGSLHIPAGVWILLLLVLLLIGGFWQDAYRAVAPRSVARIP